MNSLSSIVTQVAGRLSARRELLGVGLVGIVGLVIATALDWGAGILALAALVCYVLLRPATEADADTAGAWGPSPGGQSGDVRQALIDAMPDPAWILDSNRIVLNANAPARGIFASLRTGISVASAVRNPELIEAVERALESGAAQSALLHQRVPIDRRLAVVAAPLRGERDPEQTPAVLVTLRDLTEQDRLVQMRADFVANASHELRTPLASLRGFVETLQGPARNDPAARDRFLTIMSAQAERMTRLIDDLLSLSRVEMRQHLAPTGTVDLTEIVPQAIQGLEPQAAKANIELAYKSQAQPLLVRGDRDELLQVVQNLVQNGIKYGRDGGRVDVRLQRLAGGAGKRSEIELDITDNGPGIPAEHIPRLTERFYRVNAPQSRDKGGTGLGLAIVKHIVSRHGGILRIASKVGEGSTFAILLEEMKN